MPLLFVLDDDRAVGQTIRTIAQDPDTEVQVFHEADRFKEAFQQGPRPDGIMLDLQLGDQDGVDVLRYLAAQTCTAKIIVMSGSDPRIIHAAEQVGKGYGLNIAGLLKKPFRAAQIRTALQNLALGPSSGRSSELPIEKDLHRALVAREFVLHYQPKVSFERGRLVGAEALIRWRHPRRGLVPPGEFIPVVEATGLIVPLTHWVIEEAARQVAAWREEGLEIRVSVNVPAEMLNDLALPDTLDRLLRGHGVACRSIVLEVTESGIMRDMQTATDVLTRLRLKGVGLSIDDFGTGYSSLVKLHRLPFSELKIDRSFVKSIDTDGEARLLTETMIELGHKLGLSVVAEGPESPEVLDQLRQLGCDMAQGYVIAKPMPVDTFAAWAKALTTPSPVTEDPAEVIDLRDRRTRKSF